MILGITVFALHLSLYLLFCNSFIPGSWSVSRSTRQLLKRIQNTSNFNHDSPKMAFIEPSSSSSTTRLKVSQKVNFNSFTDFLRTAGDSPILVDFYATWCKPCTMMQPVLEDLANRLDHIARIAKIDVEQAYEVLSQYNIEGLPTILLFHKGQLLDKYVGYQDADKLEGQIRKTLRNVGIV